MRKPRILYLVCIIRLIILAVGSVDGLTYSYKDALSKSILFYQAQRSGKLPSDQQITWRSDSAVADGSAANVDLSGGYYDAGDNVKFGFPMAFTTTMLSWSAVQYSGQLSKAGELKNVQTAIRWATDYFLKAHTGPTQLYVQVGDPNTDHNCWERPEDMDTSRPVQKIDENSPGSEVAAETAAALAAASIAFQYYDSAYSTRLLAAAVELFNFANQYRGTFSGACPFYCSYSGYNDELLWAAGWLYKATKSSSYINFVVTNQNTINAISEFSWENKCAGVQVLLAKYYFEGQTSLARYKQQADTFMCYNLPGNTYYKVPHTPGGLVYLQSGANLQYAINAAFLAVLYSDYLTAANIGYVSCGGVNYTPNNLLQFATGQVNYILGNNPLGLSYMVGFGKKYPQQAHHRGASIDSIKVHPAHVGCGEGFSTWFARNASNPNLLTGAVVGGPDAADGFQDVRSQSSFTEPTTYTNAPFVGILAKLYSVYFS